MASLLNEAPPASVLVVAAHPDDIEYMAGGTLAHWIAQGTTVHYLLVTDGCGGSRDPQQTPEELASIRRAEQCCAAGILGVESVTFLGLPDATLEPTYELRLQIARVIRRVRPAAVLTFDPHTHYRTDGINHPDHVAVGVSTLGAVMPLANTLLAAPALAEEGLAPHDVAAVYLFEASAPTHWMPLSADTLARKLAALRAHASQLALWDGESCARARATDMAARGRAHGLRCRFAESFTRILLSAPAPSGQLGRRTPFRTRWPSLAGLLLGARG